MFRYLALLWSTQDERQSHAAQQIIERIRALVPRWEQALDARGFKVFCADSRPASLGVRLLPEGRGVILGALFKRHADRNDDSPSPPAQLDAADVAALTASRGRWLIDHCWGDYVALITDPDRPWVWALKDPSGELPCYITSCSGVTLVFSAISDCTELKLLRFTLNRAYLAARVLSDGEGLRPLAEVEPVHRGQCVAIDPADYPAVQARQVYWNPLDYSERAEALDDPDAAAQAMRAVVRSASRTWAACHEHFLLRLSGGLDSSIIAGSLRDGPGQPVCYTYFNPSGRSDERPWARLAAQYCGYRHLECSLTPADIHLPVLLEMPAMVEPAPVLGFLHRSTLERQLAQSHAVTAVFNGDGGDSGFCAESLQYAVPEYLRRHGIRRETFRLASQVALRRQQSSWEVLTRSLRIWLFGARMSEHHRMMLMVSQLANPDLRASYTPSTRYLHPWFEERRRIPWATIRRIGMLPHSSQFYNVAQPSEAAPEIIAPLYSQPVMELLLRIPLYRHFENGRDRGLARRAFAPDVPQPILQRLWKDRGPGFHDETLRLNRDFLRQQFLDGVLVREGLLNRTLVEQTFSSAPSKNTVLVGEIFKQLEIELWARHWQ